MTLPKKGKHFIKNKKFPKKFGFNVVVDDDDCLDRDLGLIVGDFDNDGDSDLIVSKPNKMTSDYFYYNPADLYYLENRDKDYTFKKRKIDLKGFRISTPLTATGDFNNDGFLDFVAAGTRDSNSTGGIIIALGNGDGSFSTVKNLEGCLGTWLPSNIKMFVSDINGDNNLDFIIPWIPDGPRCSSATRSNLCLDIQNKYGSWIVPFFGDGEGNFVNSRIDFHEELLEMVPSSISGGDFNKDGKVDLVVIGSDNELAIFLQK